MGEKYTEAQKKATLKYLKEKTDSIQIRTPKGTKARWRRAAAAQNISLNQFIITAVEEKIAAAPPSSAAAPDTPPTSDSSPAPVSPSGPDAG